MVDWSARVQEFVDRISASVAVVRHDEKGALVISACNERFFDMTGGRGRDIDGLPTPFDSVLPSYARHDFRQKLQECFNSGVAQELEQAYDLRDGTIGGGCR